MLIIECQQIQSVRHGVACDTIFGLELITSLGAITGLQGIGANGKLVYSRDELALRYQQVGGTE